MNARVSLALIAAVLLSAAAAHAACSPGQAGGCAKVNLDAVPEITQQIIAQESTAPSAKLAIPTAATPPQFYTGPTVGVTNQARRAPTVGYHWSID